MNVLPLSLFQKNIHSPSIFVLNMRGFLSKSSGGKRAAAAAAVVFATAVEMTNALRSLVLSASTTLNLMWAVVSASTGKLSTLLMDLA